MARRPGITRADIAIAVRACVTVARAEIRRRLYFEAARYYRTAARLSRWSGDGLSAAASERKADEAERKGEAMRDKGGEAK